MPDIQALEENDFANNTLGVMPIYLGRIATVLYTSIGLETILAQPLSELRFLILG